MDTLIASADKVISKSRLQIALSYDDIGLLKLSIPHSLVEQSCNIKIANKDAIARFMMNSVVSLTYNTAILCHILK